MSFVNHTLCHQCFVELYPDKEPYRLRSPLVPELCCRCGCTTWDGIYLRGRRNEFRYCSQTEGI